MVILQLASPNQWSAMQIYEKLPSWASGRWGFTCNLLHKETARGNHRTDMPKPEECPLKEMVGENNG